ncbi:CPBP family intramembrane metalloprotease [Microvirga sp. STR05]|uniref:CPBP family intramembrane metalloprotease n=1 Tax=Hymenobacter duratus TaxID=2771356 RepID=A0ABR8JFZ7_9BACT|nr:type II CAAX endopeptidase family protein [Hymenobacter duratus]MBD2715017.1 CPBP family intramembrane metalloprotease [Hymenobacter duratus]MBR7949923.1 CPBP family intramembrane metalloprotease [Microvirga sp. STR05]
MALALSCFSVDAIVTETPVVAPKSAIKVYPTIKESWGFLGWYLLALIITGIPLYAVAKGVFALSESVSGILITVGSNLVLLAFLRWKVGSRGQSLQLTGLRQMWLLAVLPLLVFAFGMVLTLSSFLHLPDWTHGAFEKLVQKPWITLPIGVVVVPVLEELIFRGVLLQGLLRNYRPWIAIGQSSFLFGLVHFNPAQSLNACLIGMLLGWLYYRTRSLSVGIAVHALNNLLAFAAIIWLPNVKEAEDVVDFLGGPWLYGGVVLLSAAVLAIILRQVYKATDLRTETSSTEVFEVPAADLHSSK